MRGASSIFHRVYAHESPRVPLQMETNLYTTGKKKKEKEKRPVVALVINRIERLFYFFLFFISSLFFFLDLDRTTFFTHELLVPRQCTSVSTLSIHASHRVVVECVFFSPPLSFPLFFYDKQNICPLHTYKLGCSANVKIKLGGWTILIESMEFYYSCQIVFILTIEIYVIFS